MKLPWVPRSTFELAMQARDAEKEHSRVLRSQLADLTQKYHVLRLAGFEAPPPLHQVQVVQREIDPLVQMINERSGGNRSLRSMMMRQLAEDRKAGMADAEIAIRIGGGMSVIEDGVPA